MDEAKFSTLTPAERSVLRASLGRTNEQIATFLGISANTVAAHMLAARRKLGSPSRGDAARALHEEETANQLLTRPSLVMADSLGERHISAVDIEPLRETRTPFLFSEPPVPTSSQGTVTSQDGRGERILMILLAMTLLLSSIRFLPDLVERARQFGDVLNPVLNWIGAKRSD